MVGWSGVSPNIYSNPSFIIPWLKMCISKENSDIRWTRIRKVQSWQFISWLETWPSWKSRTISHRPWSWSRHSRLQLFQRILAWKTGQSRSDCCWYSRIQLQFWWSWATCLVIVRTEGGSPVCDRLQARRQIQFWAWQISEYYRETARKYLETYSCHCVSLVIWPTGHWEEEETQNQSQKVKICCFMFKLS